MAAIGELWHPRTSWKESQGPVRLVGLVAQDVMQFDDVLAPYSEIRISPTAGSMNNVTDRRYSSPVPGLQWTGVDDHLKSRIFAHLACECGDGEAAGLVVGGVPRRSCG